MDKIEVVKSVVEQHFNLEPGMIDRNCRSREIIYPRQLAHWLCRWLNGYSLSTIGKRIGNKDHSTVINSCRVINNDLTYIRGHCVCPETEATVARLKLKVRQKLSKLDEDEFERWILSMGKY